MGKKLEGKLSKEILESTDIELFRSLRDWADDKVQSMKQAKEKKKLEKYKPDIEGKFLRQCEYKWEGPIQVPDPNNTKIVYVKKIDFVGTGFIRCNVVVINITYGGFKERVDLAGFSSKDFGELCMSVWEDDQYDISFEYLKDPQYMIKEEVEKTINDALENNKTQASAFWSKVNE